jgi:hypothetical protein
LLLDLGLFFRCPGGAIRCTDCPIGRARGLTIEVQRHCGDKRSGDSYPSSGIHTRMLSLIARA